MVKERNSSIELLRIISEIGVVFLHLNASLVEVLNSEIPKMFSKEMFINFEESIFICSVNTFIFISAYFLSQTNERKISKIINLYCQTITIRILSFLVETITDQTIELTFSKIILILSPLNYFFILYSVLYVVSPYINICFMKLSKNQAKKMIIILFAIFSIYSYTVDLLYKFGDFSSMSPIGLYGNECGYTIVNFILIYTIASYFANFKTNIYRKKIIKYYLTCLIIVFAISAFSPVAWYYNSPFIIIMAVCSFFIFKNICFKSKLIVFLSKGCFMCYLTNNLFLKYIPASYIISKKIIEIFALQLVISVFIFLLSYSVYLLYRLTIGNCLNRYSKNIDNYILYELSE